MQSLTNTSDLYRTKLTPCGLTYTFRYLDPFVSGRRVLDLGSGTGEYLSQFSAQSMGVEISDPNIALCRSKGLNIIKADLNNSLPFDSCQFDTVFSSHTIEHVESPLNFLRECHRVVKKSGHVIIAVPTEKTLVRLVKEDYFIGHRGHIYGISIESMQRLFEFSRLTFIKVFFNFPFIRTIPTFDKWLQERQILKCQYISTMYWAVGVKQEL